MDFPPIFSLIIQILTILLSLLTIAISISVLSLEVYFRFDDFGVCLTCIILSLLVIATELYAVNIYKYFMFLFTLWGKAAIFIAMGLLLFDLTNTMRIGTAAVLWFFGLAYIVLYFIGLKKLNPPLLQKNLSLNVQQSDCFQEWKNKVTDKTITCCWCHNIKIIRNFYTLSNYFIPH